MAGAVGSVVGAVGSIAAVGAAAAADGELVVDIPLLLLDILLHARSSSVRAQNTMERRWSIAVGTTEASPPPWGPTAAATGTTRYPSLVPPSCSLWHPLAPALLRLQYQASTQHFLPATERVSAPGSGPLSWPCAAASSMSEYERKNRRSVLGGQHW